jgi:N-acyl homoserine lactone hydrolase
VDNTNAIRHVWALDAPMITCDKSSLLTGGESGDWTIPAPIFLIEHRAHGLVIFDTGLAAEAAGDPAAVYGTIGQEIPMHFPAEYRLDRQLDALGFSITDIRRVVLSHLHFDHTGGLQYFAGAEGYIGEGEVRYARSPDAHVAGFFRDEDLAAAAKIPWNEVPQGYDHDLFGDGSITLLSLPGHTPGTLGLQVRINDRTLVLTGDTAHIQENIDTAIGIPFDADTVGAIRSLKRLALMRMRPDTTVWVNHDPSDWAKHRSNGMDIFAD